MISDGPGDIVDRQVCLTEERAGAPDAEVQQILLGRCAGDIFEEPVQIGALNIQMIRNHLDIDLVGVVVLDISERLFNIGDLPLLRRDIFPGKLAGE